MSERKRTSEQSLLNFLHSSEESGKKSEEWNLKGKEKKIFFLN